MSAYFLLQGLHDIRTQSGEGQPVSENLFNRGAFARLDGKTGLVTVLLAGKQGWKCPVALLATCCGSKSLKVILIGSDFRAYPVLNPLVTL